MGGGRPPLKRTIATGAEYWGSEFRPNKLFIDLVRNYLETKEDGGGPGRKWKSRARTVRGPGGGGLVSFQSKHCRGSNKKLQQVRVETLLAPCTPFNSRNQHSKEKLNSSSFFSLFQSTVCEIPQINMPFLLVALSDETLEKLTSTATTNCSG